MNKKILIQGILLLILVLSLSTFSLKYFSKEANESVVDIENDTLDTNQNLIKNIKYSSKNKKGDIFFLIADFGEVSLKNSNQLFLTNVKGQITISSTLFKFLYVNPKKVQNRAILKGNIKILKDEYKIISDVVEIDLITLDSKVYMLDKNKKVSIENY